uniref:protein timeless homolog n=1 Tax=Myxine glutinosa TaxID=7769 RepID=UPI00358E8A49
MDCDLLATCSSLGFLEGDTYHKEPDCLETVKDLIRFLRGEDDRMGIRRQLGVAQILQKDLLPLVVHYHTDRPLFEAVVRLLVNLTQPAVVWFGKVPTDVTGRQHYITMTSHLQDYKEAFADNKVISVLAEKLYELLQLKWEERQEEDSLLTERLLLLVRNVLHIPPNPTDKGVLDENMSVHDHVLWAVHMSGLDDILKFLASSPTEQHWALHTLEIVSLMFREQSASVLVMSGKPRSEQEKAEAVAEILTMHKREQMERQQRLQLIGSRHSRFGGTFRVQGLKSVSDEDMVYHLPVQTFDSYNHDVGKPVKRRPRRKQLAQEVQLQRRSALSVRFFLQEFCHEFLENCYNRIMYTVKNSLTREQAQEHDETYYLWSLAFFMEFNRVVGFRPELVSETVQVRSFHFVERCLMNCYEMMLVVKTEEVAWARRMHLALRAYQELIMTLSVMDGSPNEKIRESANVIKSNIFYVMEYRELFVTLFRKYDETKQPLSFLRDLVETAHIFFKMLEKLCNQRRKMCVQKKYIKRKKKIKSKTSVAPVQGELTAEAKDLLWDKMSKDLDASMKAGEPVPEDVVPFDAASEVPVEEQRTEAAKRIQKALFMQQPLEALGLLKAAREVWPEGGMFGTVESHLDEELQLLHQIFNATLPGEQLAAIECREEDKDENVLEEHEEEEFEEDEEDEQSFSVKVTEKDFLFLDYIKRFANTQVIKACVFLLKHYRNNSVHTNHCATKILHRIAVDLHMDGLLFQASVFRTFQAVLEDPAVECYSELARFAKYIVRRFVELARRNSKVFLELLFWKSPATVHQMTEGYTETQGTGSHKGSHWSDAEKEELQTLYLHYKDEAGDEKDVVDFVMEHIQDDARTRKQIIGQLIRQGIADSVLDFKRKPGKKSRLVLWREEQEMELQRLFEEFRDSSDVMGNIMQNITAKRSRAHIAAKLIVMGLVNDRQELRKKRHSKACTVSSKNLKLVKDVVGDDHRTASDLDDRSSSEDGDVDDDDEDDEDDEEVQEQVPPKDRNKKRRSRDQLEVWDEKTLEKDVDFQVALQQARDEGLSGPLAWLQMCLGRTANDREDDGYGHPVPLVPLSEENEDAMENKVFQKLLRKIGLRRPEEVQESFWRIPEKLSVSNLRAVAKQLANCKIPLEVQEPSDEPGGAKSERQQEEKESYLVETKSRQQHCVEIDGGRTMMHGHETLLGPQNDDEQPPNVESEKNDRHPKRRVHAFASSDSDSDGNGGEALPSKRGRLVSKPDSAMLTPYVSGGECEARPPVLLADADEASESDDDVLFLRRARQRIINDGDND